MAKNMEKNQKQKKSSGANIVSLPRFP